MRSFLRLGASLVAIAVCSAAEAQTTAPGTESAEPSATTSPPAAPVVADGSASTAAPSSGGLQDIVVTATRREERLQQIPVTVTAITSETLARGGVVDARTLTQLTPGLTYTRAASLGQPVIRGVGSTGTSPGDESNIATYVDGVYQASPYATLGELVNVERVEVLRGPQGTVFGRNATGGLINIITPDPKFTPHGNFSATYGRLRNDANDVDLRAYITGPISSTLAADFSGLFRRDDGYIKDLLRGGELGKNRVYALRSKLMFRPSDRAKIILTGDYSKQDGASIAYRVIDRFSPGALVPGFIDAGPWEAATDTYPVYDYKRFSASLRTSFDLGFANLETTGAYNYSYSTQWNDSDGTNFGISTANPRVTAKTYSQEIRLLSQGAGPFKWIVGAYFFDLKTSAPTLLLRGAPPAVPLAVRVNINPSLATRSYAGFAEGTYEVLDKLFLTGGVRYTSERRTYHADLLLPLVVRLPVGGSTPKSNVNKLTYRGAVRYQITPRTNIYGSYGTGFKSGVFNGYAVSLAPNFVNFVKPETLKAAEVGVKSDITRQLRVNVSAYHYNYRNLQVNARDPVRTEAFLLQNAPKVTIYGGELEVTVAPTPELTISGFATYTHGRYDDFPLAQTFLPRPVTEVCLNIVPPATPIPPGGNVPCALANAAGRQLVRMPTTTFNLRPSWQHELASGTLELSATLFHSSRVYWDYANTRAFSQKPYTLVAADIGYRLRNGWRFNAAVTNIFDEQVTQQNNVSEFGAITLLERPRRVSVTAGYSF